MVLPESEEKILVLSFHKENFKASLFDLEKWFIFGLSQVFNLFTDATFLDYAIPENRISFENPPTLEGSRSDIKKLGARLNADYVLCGWLKQEIGLTQDRDGVRVHLQLFNLKRERCALHLEYFFRAFDEQQSKGNQLIPTWEGLSDLILWAAFQIIGAVYPEKAPSLYPKIQLHTLAEDFSSYQRLAGIHYAPSEVSNAQKLPLLQHLAQEEPAMLLAHYKLGLLYKRMKEYPHAIVSLEHAFDLMKDISPHRKAFCATEIGVCYALCQNFKKACEWWRTAIFEDPSWISAYMNLAHAKEEMGNLVEAEQLFKRAGEIAPTDNRVCLNLARLYSKQEQWDKAIIQYEHLLALEPTNPWAYSNMANCYLQKGDLERAKTYLTKTLEVDPEGEAGRFANLVLSGLLAAEV